MTALYTVSQGGTINSSDLNQYTSTLQVPSGGQETGVYYIHGNASTAGGIISAFVQSRSRGSTPASVSYDTSIALTTLQSITTDTLNQYGFHISGQSYSTPQAGSRAAGNYLIQY